MNTNNVKRQCPPGSTENIRRNPFVQNRSPTSKRYKELIAIEIRRVEIYNATSTVDCKGIESVFDGTHPGVKILSDAMHCAWQKTLRKELTFVNLTEGYMPMVDSMGHLFGIGFNVVHPYEVGQESWEFSCFANIGSIRWFCNVSIVVRFGKVHMSAILRKHSTEERPIVVTKKDHEERIFSSAFDRFNPQSVEVSASFVRNQFKMDWKGIRTAVESLTDEQSRLFYDNLEPGVRDILFPHRYQMGMSDNVRDFFFPNVEEQFQEACEEAVSVVERKLSTKASDMVQIAGVLLGAYGLSQFAIGLVYSDENATKSGISTMTTLGAGAAMFAYTNRYQGVGDITGQVCDAFTSVVSEVLKLKDLTKSIRDWSNTVVSLDKLRKTLPELVIFFLETIDSFIEWVFGVRPCEGLFPNVMGVNVKFNQTLNKAKRFCEEFRLGTEETCVDQYDRAFNLRIELDNLVLLADKNSPKYNLLYLYRKDLEDIRKTLLTTIPGLESQRVEPKTVLFVGSPGSYKTTMMNRLSDVTGQRIKDWKKLDFSPAKFQMDGAPKYFDGYSSGTQLISWDEFGQLRDAVGSAENEYFQFIKMVNVNPCPLNMASVEAKGSTFCKARSIVGTTNCKKWSIESLIDPGAVHRRWQRQFIACPIAAFGYPGQTPLERSVNWEAVRLAKGIDPGCVIPPLENHEMEFYEYTGPMHDRKQGRFYTFEQICELHFQDIVQAEDIHKANVALGQVELNKIHRFSTLPPEEDPNNVKEWQHFEIFFSMDTLFSGLRDYYLDLEDNYSIFPISMRRFVAIKEQYLEELKERSIGLEEKMKDNEFKCLFDRMKLFISDTDYRWEALKTLQDQLKVILPLAMVCSLFLRRDSHKEVEESQQFQSVVQKTKSKVVTGLSSLLSKEVQKPQMGHIGDPNGYTLLKKALSRNQYTIYLESGENQVVKNGYGLMIVGTMMLVPMHFILEYEALSQEALTENRKVIFSQKRGEVDKIRSISVRDLMELVVYPNKTEIRKDICFIKLPISWGLHVDIRDMFRSEKELHKYPHLNSASLLIQHADIVSKKGEVALSSEFWTSHGSTNLIKSAKVEYNDNIHEIGPLYQYDFQTTDGCCGAILADFNKKIQKEKIVGIHVTGNVLGFGTSQFVSSEDIEFAYNAAFAGQAEGAVLNLPLHLYEVGKTSISINLVPLYKVKAARSNPTSSFVKSPIQGLCAPPLLFPSNVRSEVIPEAMTAYRRGVYCSIDFSTVRHCLDAYKNFLFSSSTKTVPVILPTWEECVTGIEGYDFPTVSRMTSCGYPWVLSRKLKGKCDWLGDGQDYHFDNENWRSLVKSAERLEFIMSKNQREICPFMINLKDELRKPGKIARVFGAGPFDLLLVCYKYFGAFIAWFQLNRIKNGSTLGINSYSTEWHELATYLKFEYVLAGDFKQFDQSQHPDIVYMLLEVIELFYEHSTQEDRNVRRMLFLDCIMPFYVYEDHVYEAQGGLPSGHLLTAVVNTLLNSLLQILSVYECCNKRIPAVECLKWFRFVCNGDDSLVSIRKEDVDLITEEKFSEVLSRYGFVYTSDSKDGTFAKGRILEEVTYLKRTFRFEPTKRFYVAPLLLPRLLEFPNWTKKNDGMEILRTNLEKFLVELSAHGKSIFSQYAPTIIQAYKEHWTVAPKVSTWYGCLESFCTNTEYNFTFQSNMTFTTYIDLKRQDLLELSFINTLTSGNRDTTEKFEVISKYQMNNNVIEQDNDVDATFLNNAMVVKSEMPFKNGSEFNADTQGGRLPTEINRWLERPVIFNSGTLASTDNANTFATWKWHEPLTNIDILKNKMLGTFTIRADLKIKLVINANPFQQGMYVLAYLPHGGSYGSAVNTPFSDWNLAHRHCLTQITQLPHVKFDINCDTEVELYIPWASGISGFPFRANTTNTWGMIGTFFLYPVVPITAASGSLTASYTLYTSYHNIELGVVGFPQMGKVTKKKDLLAQEQEGLKPSDYLKMGSDVTGALSSVPYLSSITAPLSWVLDATSRAAKAWGFSKPTTLETPHRIARTNFVGMANSDYGNPVDSLALTFGNHVQIDQGNSNNIDELDIQGMCQRYAWIFTQTQSTSDTPGQLFTMGVNPTWFSSTTDSATSLRNYTPMGLVSTQFQHWRGDIVFRLHFVKTKFHSGRIMLAFEPYIDGEWTTGAGLLSTSDYLVRTIVDIREQQVLEVRVPFISPLPWLDRDKASGLLRYFIIDQLTAPATVSSSIKIIVEVKGENMQFNGPNGLAGVVPFVPFTYQSGSEPISCDIGAVNLAESRLADPCATTHGQKITSLRSLLKRASFARQATEPMTTTNRYTLVPFANYTYKGDGTARLGSNTVVTRDFYSILQNTFAFSRGGVVIRLIPISASSTQTNFVAMDVVGSGAGVVGNMVISSAVTTGGFQYAAVGLGMSWSQVSTPAQGFLLPQHSKTLSRVNACNSITTLKSLDFAHLMADPVQLIMYQQGGTAIPCYWTREGADDCSFSNFVSVPPIYIDASA